MQQFILTKDSFFPQAKKLRGVFEDRFIDPKAAHNNRFVWDYWHVPDQYTFVRTPAEHYFPKTIFRSFENSLLEWGRRNLGCTGISPSWLSYYVDGCEQQLHSDVPHGPWAFVYSLTPWRGRKFSGGETMILRPSVLEYWKNFDDAQDRELHSFVQFLPSPFNRLTVFDPRFPHGVSEVRGTKNPLEGRLVIHGWFVEPKPVLEGALSAARVAPVLDEAVYDFQHALVAYGKMHGTLSVRIAVAADGHVHKCQILTNTLMATDFDPRVLSSVSKLLQKSLNGLRFPRAKAGTVITLPLLFR